MNNFILKMDCNVDSKDYITLEAGYAYPTMYFTCTSQIPTDDGKIDEEVCVALNRKQVKKLRKFLKGWLDETLHLD